MKKQAIRMKIKSTRFEMPEFLFSQLCAEIAEDMPEINIPEELATGEPEVLEINTDGFISHEDGRVELSYDESELTGMEGAKTAISYSESEPALVTMIRTGSVSTALVFESGKRHHCVYKTPYMPFEVCVHTVKVINEIEEKHSLFIDYIIEIRGAKAERTRLELTYLE